MQILHYVKKRASEGLWLLSKVALTYNMLYAGGVCEKSVEVAIKHILLWTRPYCFCKGNTLDPTYPTVKSTNTFPCCCFLMFAKYSLATRRQKMLFRSQRGFLEQINTGRACQIGNTLIGHKLSICDYQLCLDANTNILISYVNVSPVLTFKLSRFPVGNRQPVFTRQTNDCFSIFCVCCMILSSLFVLKTKMASLGWNQTAFMEQYFRLTTELSWHAKTGNQFLLKEDSSVKIVHKYCYLMSHSLMELFSI